MEARVSDRRHFFYELRAWPQRLALKTPPPIFLTVIGNQYDRFASCLGLVSSICSTPSQDAVEGWIAALCSQSLHSKANSRLSPVDNVVAFTVAEARLMALARPARETTSYA